MLRCFFHLFPWTEPLWEERKFLGVLVADVDCLDCLNKYMLFFQLYKLTEVLIRTVFVLFNWLILLLNSLPNNHSDSGGTFFANGCILAGNRSFICFLLNGLFSAVTTPKRAKASATGVIISLYWSDLSFIRFILHWSFHDLITWICHTTSCPDSMHLNFLQNYVIGPFTCIEYLTTQVSSLHLGVMMFVQFSGLL